MSPLTTLTVGTVVMCVAALVAGTAALADHAQPPPEIGKMDYAPIGHFKPGGPVPADAGKACDAVLKPLMNGSLFNPSDKWNAFDTNVFETLCLPFRGAGDESDSDPWGNGGEPRHGYCAGANPANPVDPGECPNHQLEYIAYYEATMRELLRDFGVSFHRYEFENPGNGNTRKGRAINPAAVVPGADHAEQQVVIGAHFDQTTTGPASTWDSAEGHAQVIRVAKILADYWRATGTRPAATVKFIPWDGEETGTLGSRDYASNYILEGEEDRVRGYWNTDPCAGGYPAFRFGNRADRVNLGIQIGNSDSDRVQAFNRRAPQLVEQVFDHLDDKLESYPEAPELFVSTGEDAVRTDIGKDVFVGTDQPVLFSSDWRNFIALGIPFFNPGPEITGPSMGGMPGLNSAGNPDGVLILHRPLDNLVTMNRYTGGDPTGMTWSEAWIKGMEMCAHLLAWGMLQPDQGGAQTATTEPVAYFETAPVSSAARGSLVTFDASGSYQYADPAARNMVDAQQLQFKWELGDGVVAYGRTVRHAYRRPGVYKPRLTVTNRRTGQADAMTVTLPVAEGTGRETDPPGQDSDTLPGPSEVVSCARPAALGSAQARAARTKLRVDAGASPVTIELFRAAERRRAIAPRRVIRLAATKPVEIDGRRLRPGVYYVRVSIVRAGARETRTFPFERTSSRFRSLSRFERGRSCDLLSLFVLGSPAFGGKRGIDVAFAVSRPARVTVALLRGRGDRRPLSRYARTVATPNRAQRLRIPVRGLGRGEYRVVATAVAGNAKVVATLATRRP